MRRRRERDVRGQLLAQPQLVALVRGARQVTPDQIHAGQDVAPLVAAANLQRAAVPLQPVPLGPQLEAP